MYFLDVPPSHWAANDVNDLAGIDLHGYGKFIESIPYNVYEENYPAYDKMFPVETWTTEFNLGVYIKQSADNPISVFHNGVEVGYAELKLDENNNTVVVLRRAANPGSFVRIICPGKAKIDTNNLLQVPVGVGGTYKLPEKLLGFKNPEKFGDKHKDYYYIYDQEHQYLSEYATWKGAQLKRVPYFNVLDDLPATGKPNDYIYIRNAKNTDGAFYKWDTETNSWVVDAIPKENKMYTISPDGLLITPYGMHNELINIRYIVGLKDGFGNVMKSSYQLINEVTYAESNYMVYVNRYFPDTYVSRLQLIAFLDRLRVHLLLEYANYKDYSELVVTKSISKSVFSDVRSLTGYEWWWKHLANLENLKLSTGEYLLNFDENGSPITDGRPRPKNAKIGIYASGGKEYPVNRGETAWFLNRFRKYFLEILV